MIPDLRWYQGFGIDELRRHAAAGRRRLLLVMATGGGKTNLAMALMAACADKGKRSLFVADKRDLVVQAARRFRAAGLPAGIILADCPRDYWDLIDRHAPIQVCSKQTLVARALKGNKLTLPEADLVVADEAHRSVSQWWSKLLERYPKAWTIGLTATPVTSSGRGLGAYYEAMVEPVKPSQLLAEGYLVPAVCYAPTFPDLKGLKTDANGDYVKKQLEERMNRDNMIGDVVGWWKRLGQNRPTFCFASGVNHSIHLKEQFLAAGVKAVHLDESSDNETRRDALADVAAGRVQVVTSYEILSEGIDVPAVSCIVIVRPTKKLRVYLQAIGRGMRPHPTKKDMLVIDHAGTVLLHGLPGTDIDWQLEDNGETVEARQGRMKPPGAVAPVVCQRCKAIYPPQPQCPICGFKVPRFRMPQAEGGRQGTLELVTADGLPDRTVSLSALNGVWRGCLAAAANRGQKLAQAAAIFRSKTKRSPWEAGVSPLPESPSDWQRPAQEVFPGYVRRKKESAGV